MAALEEELCQPKRARDKSVHEKQGSELFSLPLPGFLSG